MAAAAVSLTAVSTAVLVDAAVTPATSASLATDTLSSPGRAASTSTVGRAVDAHGQVKRAVKGTHYAKVVPACSAPRGAHHNVCFALRRVPAKASTPGAKRYVVPASYPVGPAAGYTPSDLWAAYGLGSASSLTAASGPGTGQIVGIVDAYDAPTIEADLATFDAEYALPACTTGNGCFTKLNQAGAVSPLPAAAGTVQGSSGWDQETSLDVEAVHAVCPNCKILLIESNSSLSSDMGAAANEAVALGATEVSNSYGGAEFTDSTNQGDYAHGAIALMTASAGDDGYFNYLSSTQQHKANTPAAYNSVVAVGGTALKLDHVGARASEGVWNDVDGPNAGTGAAGATGGGCSALFSAITFQSSAPGYSNAGCGGERLVSDVSAIGDPLTGFDTYDSFSGAKTWQTVGGTSLSSPVVAAMFALAGGTQHVIPARTLYTNLTANPAALYDVTVGGNGSCGGTACTGQPAAQDCNGTTACDAAVGFDGASGVGAPLGLADLSPVIASFTAPGAGDPGVEVDVDASASSSQATGASIDGYHWDWGDGTTTTTTTPTTSHTYPDPGRYTLTLKASTSSPTATSVPTTRSIRIGHPEPIISSVPTLTGTATDLQTLTEHNGTWTNSPTSFSYAWQRCDAAGANCSTISHAASQSYHLLDADIGHTIEAVETASNAGGASDPGTSLPTSVVAAASPNTAAFAAAGASTSTGTVPQSLAISPSGQFMAVANQSSNDISVYSVNSSGALTPVTGSPFAAGGNTPAYLAFSPDGKFLAVSNLSGAGSLSMFTVAGNGALTTVPGSPFAFSANGWNVAPTQLSFSPDSSLLATTTTTGPSARSLIVFAISATGVPTQSSGSPVSAAITMPTSAAFSPSGDFLAVTSSSTAVLQMLSVGSDETFTSVAGSPYTVGTGPVQATFSPGGSLLAVPYSGHLSMYAVDGAGALTAATGSPITLANNPTNLFFSPAGRLLSIGSNGSTVPVYSYATDGSLTALSGSPYACQSSFCQYGAGAFSSDGSLLAVPNRAMNTVEMFAQGSAPTVPSAPTGVSASAGDGQALVSWTAASAHGSPITGYTVTSSPDAKTCTTTGTTQCSVTGLTNGTAYTFTVVATNGVGAGPASTASSSVTPTAAPTVPSAPTGVSASAGNAQALVSWNAAAANGSAITGYTVTSSPGSKTCSTTSATQCTVTGLTNGTAYTFKVVATNGVGAGPASAASGSVTPVGVPSAPTGVSATAGDAQALVSWTAAAANGSAITGYTVTSSPDAKTCSTTTATQCTVTGLTDGTAYTFKVVATNGVGAGPASAASSNVTPVGVPSAPTGVSATAGDAQALVSWTAAAPHGSTITDYTVTSSPGSKTCSTTTATQCTVTGLTDGTAYTFKVVATNGVGAGPASAASSNVTPVGVPSAPTGVSATAGDAQALVSWTAAAPHGSTITGYTVTSSPDAKTCSTTAIQCTVTGLTNGTGYTFTVVATNGVGAGPASTASSSVTPAATPGPPTNVSASAGDAQALVNWTAAAANGSDITDYTVTSSPGAKTCSTTGTTQCTVTGLTNGTAYTFTVIATNGVGAGPASVASSSVTPTATPTIPGAPTGVTATAGDGQALVNWTAAAANGSDITDYTVTSSPDAKTCSTTGTTQCTVTGLTNGTGYTFTVVATNGVGAGPASDASNSVTPVAPTAPSAPTHVTATADNAQALVNWTAAAANGSAITDYTVTSSPDAKTCSTSGTTHCTVTGLTNGTGYTFTVVATNGVGAGPASDASNSVTPSAPTVPGAPTGVVATAGDAQAVVKWAAAAANGSPITGYTVTSSPGAKTCSTTGTTQCTVSGLADGTAYTFTVVATNGVGTGPASDPSSSVTPAAAAPPPPPEPTGSSAPDAPTNVVAAAGDAAASLSWTAAEAHGSPVTAYTVTSSPDAKSCSTTGATQCTVSGLTNGTAYTFKVVATNGVGSSPASAASNSVTPVDSTPPTIAMNALRDYTLAKSVTVGYLGQDNDKVSSYDVRLRAATSNSALSAVVYPAAWQQTGSTTQTVRTHPGDTYCFAARSRDAAGNVSAWSAERCTAVPMDDRAFKTSPGWSQSRGHRYFEHTASTSSTKGSTLAANVRTKTVWLVASTCATCGKVGVYWNGKLLNTVSLAGKSANRVMIAVAAFHRDRAGTVTLKDRSKGRRVTIDGVALSAVAAPPPANTAFVGGFGARGAR